MPNTYYWQGSTAAAGIARYDWNYGPNWKVANWSKPYTQWATSATAPGINDSAYVGEYFVARSPILYGGYSGGVAGHTTSTLWLNAQQTTGTTFNSSLNTFSAKLATPKSTTGTSYYPYPWLGGGITGDVYNWAINVNSLSAASLTGVTGERANLGLTLKTSGNVLILTTGQINRNYSVGGTDASGYPNYTVVNLNGVPSKNYNNGGTAACITSLLIGGETYMYPPPAPTWEVGLGNITINSGAFNSISIDNGVSGSVSGLSGAPARPFKVNLTNVVANNVAVHNGDINVDKSCTFGTFTVKGGANPYYLAMDEYTKVPIGYNGRQINLAGTYNSTSAANLLGWAPPSATSSPFVSGVYLYDQFTTVPGNYDYDYTPTILLSNPSDGATFTAQTLAVFNEVSPYSMNTSGNAQRPWRIEFFGDANITSMSTEGTTIAAWAQLDPSKQLNISRLTLAERSVLDLQYAKQFDNWYFGSITGNTVAGGINFADDTCEVLGSAGVRLYNTKVVNNFDFRAQENLKVVYQALDVGPAGGFGLDKP
jgi:hypothetical protein